MPNLLCTLRHDLDDVYIPRSFCIPEGYHIVTLAQEVDGLRTIFYGKFLNI